MEHEKAFSSEDFFKLTTSVYEQSGGKSPCDGLVPNYIFPFNVWLCTLQSDCLICSRLLRRWHRILKCLCYF